jgi:hypothetical protein
VGLDRRAARLARSYARASDPGARRAIECSGSGRESVRLKPSRKVAKALRRSRKAVEATLKVRLTALGEAPRMRTRSVTLRR